MPVTPIRSITTVALIGLLSLFAGTTALAEGSGPSGDERVSQEILEILRDKGEIDEAKYQELKKKEQAEHDKSYSIKYANGLSISRNDGFIKMKIGGRIQADFATISPSPGLQVLNPGGSGADVEFRRARLYMSGELYKRIIFKAQYDFADGVTAIADLYIGMKDLGLLGTVRFGHVKEPFSLEELTSSKHITFMERSLPTLFDSVRNFGVLATNSVVDDRVTYALGVFAPTDKLGNYFSGKGWDLTGRVTGLPYISQDGSQFVHLGLGFSYQFRDGSTRIGFTQRPESHLAKAYLNTGDAMNFGNAIMGVEFAWVHGPFSLQSEVKASFVKTTAGDKRAKAWGYYAELSYFLTGEHRVYKKKGGVFSRVKPRHSFDPSKGHWGAFEVAARYSFIDLNDEGTPTSGTLLDGGMQQDVTIAFNWHLYSNTKLMFNYVHADVKDGRFYKPVPGGVPETRSGNGNVDLFQMRAQLEF